MFRARIQIVSLCVSENQERGVCLCVCETIGGGLIQDSKATHMHSHTNTQTLRYRLYCSSICEAPAVQFDPEQSAGCLFSGVTALVHKLSPEAQPLIHTPLQPAVTLGTSQQLPGAVLQQ